MAVDDDLTCYAHVLGAIQTECCGFLPADAAVTNAAGPSVRIAVHAPWACERAPWRIEPTRGGGRPRDRPHVSAGSWAAWGGRLLVVGSADRCLIASAALVLACGCL